MALEDTLSEITENLNKNSQKRLKKKWIDDVRKWIEENEQPIMASDIDDTIVGHCINTDKFLGWLKDMDDYDVL